VHNHQDNFFNNLYYKVVYGDQEASGSGKIGIESKTLGSQIDGVCLLACISGDEEFCPSCSEDEKLMKVLVHTDLFPLETYWSVHDACTTVEVMSVSAGDYTESETRYGHVKCVPEGAYKFTIRVRA
jgi:hypothetical protein